MIYDDGDLSTGVPAPVFWVIEHPYRLIKEPVTDLWEELVELFPDLDESAVPTVHVDGADGDRLSNINISDVFEAISIADPSYGPAGAVAAPEAAMFRAGPAQAEPRPYVRIVEQPASKALRFRYECEGRSAGSIPGANSAPEKKTFPTIEICGHKGRAIVVVSCVTKDKPYRPHPHNLVGREMCKKGVCTVNVGAESPLVTFSNLGIQCVKRKDIEEALRVREEMRVDPFKTGFSHRSQPQSIDLNAVRLCFQVFLPDERTGKIRHALPPVVSDVVYDKKAMSDLVITRLSHCSAPVSGGMQVILLCEKVAREDIAVTFFERVGDQVTWQADAADVYVHKQVAICFTTPPYPATNVTRHVQAFIQLRRPTDNVTSDPLPFELLPVSADSNYLKRKRQKPLSDLTRYLQPDHDMNQQPPEFYEIMALQREQKPIKLEPRDKTPPQAMASPPHMALSPHYGEREPDHYQWNMPVEGLQAGLVIPGPSHGVPYAQEMPWQSMAQAGAAIPQAMSPNMGQALTPNMGQAMSPNMGQAMSPNMGQAMSPNMGQAMSPNMAQAMSPIHQTMGHVSPNLGHVSPNMGHISPALGHVSPNLVQQSMVQQPNLAQLQQVSLMENSEPSISGLLYDRGDIPQLNSSELSGLSSMLGRPDERPDTLSDSLTRLNTGDLLHPM